MEPFKGSPACIRSTYASYKPLFLRSDKTVSIDSTLEVLGKSFQMVLIIKETDVYNPNHRYFDYFAKNIGLIKRDSIDITDTTNLITILAIKNYKIGN